MKIRTVDVSQSDKKSAKLFFATLLDFYDLQDATALDMFARDGALTVSCYNGRIKTVDLWELMPDHREALLKFKPRQVQIGCSYASLETCEQLYDLVVIDTPQGVHHDHHGNRHFEHFDIMRRISTILKRHAIIVLYVNKRPYNKNVVGSHGYDEYEGYDFQAWMDEREVFYTTSADPSRITEEDALLGYRRVLHKQNFGIKSVVTTPCYSDVPGLEPYAFRLALEVERA